jgi:hypothetical protein
MPKITGLKNWKENETLTAQAYVYERDTIVNEVNDQDDRLLTLETEARQFIYVQPNQPSEADTNDFDLWFKILN